MSIKKKKESQTTLGNLYSPYETATQKTMTEWYEAYKNDPNKLLTVNGKTFSKIIHRCEFYLYEKPTLLVAFEPTDSLKQNDVLVDEEGREFLIRHFEMFRFSGSIPEWYFKVFSLAIQGENYAIGNYLSKK